MDTGSIDLENVMTVLFFTGIMLSLLGRNIVCAAPRTLGAALRQAHHTPLYDFHVANNGKMVEFAGYSLPVMYGKEGIIQSHMHTRTKSSMFDVSHMLQVRTCCDISPVCQF